VEFINAALERARYNQRLAADLLGLTYDQLRGKLRKHGIAGRPAPA
jgi:psp operon transcriptional activator